MLSPNPGTVLVPISIGLWGGGFSDGLGFNLVGQISERLGVDTGGVKLTSSWFNMYATLVFIGIKVVYHLTAASPFPPSDLCTYPVKTSRDSRWD